ncbi:hypothetical protein C6499_12000 [Candidatus Poribacteria bacterium]|nr:MAG: hypothetical protein C6499_12000 [Candidatus Poribacteria bacterium]
MSTGKKENATGTEGNPIREPYIEHPYVFRKSVFEEVIELVEWRGHSPVTIDLFIRACDIAEKSRALDEAINNFIDCKNTFLSDIIPGQPTNTKADSHE